MRLHVKKKCLEEAPAIFHVDNTARIQTINKNNGLIFDVLKAYKTLTNVPILINTSLNDNNEPIVFSHLDALLCFLRTNADFLIVEDKIIYRNQIDNINELTQQLIIKQKNWIEFYFRKSIKELTYISQISKSSTLSEFINFNLNLTNSFKEHLPTINLISFLKIIKKSRLITDKYHLDLIEKLSKIFPSSNFIENLNFTLLSDEFSSLNLIKEEDFILLYNMSIYLEDNPKNFYKRNSKILTLDIKESCSPNDLDQVIKSYEVDLNKNIKDFFK